MSRKICFLTAARSEYDILYPVIQAVAATAGLQAEIVACAAHLSPFHGMGIDQIRADGFPVAACVESLMSSESWQGRALSFSNLLHGMIRFFARQKPDILFIAGDREEPFAGAIAANFFGIPVAHLHGGDRCIVTELDEIIRPAISKLSHFHFTATESHRERLIRMGEIPENIWVTGATGLDRLLETPDLGDAVLNAQFGVDVSKPFFLLIHHPAPLIDLGGGGEEMKRILEAALSFGIPVFCSYPNYDPGNMGIRQAIDAAKAKNPNLIVSHNLPRDVFVSLYRRCAAILGNSSSIVIEAGFLHVPGILIGPRQDLRERGPNVMRVEPLVGEIVAACEKALRDKDFRRIVQASSSIYGDGHAAPRVAKVLAEVKLGPEVLRKTITY